MERANHDTVFVWRRRRRVELKFIVGVGDAASNGSNENYGVASSSSEIHLLI